MMMTMNAAKDEYVSSTSLNWAPFVPGIFLKLLRVCPETGTWTVLIKADAGASFPRHRHLAAGEYFMLSGKMEVRGGVEKGGITALPGDYGWEPVSIVHDHTEFPEPTEMLFTNHGAVVFIDDNDQPTSVLDWEVVQQVCAKVAARAA
jgi:quercetin dioxygenase-like cupin family protein